MKLPKRPMYRNMKAKPTGFEEIAEEVKSKKEIIVCGKKKS